MSLPSCRMFLSASEKGTQVNLPIISAPGYEGMVCTESCALVWFNEWTMLESTPTLTHSPFSFFALGEASLILVPAMCYMTIDALF